MAICRKVTLTIAEDEVSAGYYTVASYVQGDIGTLPGTWMYRKLTWTEAVDVMLVTFDEHRPGQDVGGGHTQSKLW